MSRWTTAFDHHPFQSGWREFNEKLAIAKLDDLNAAASSEELHRLKTVTAYIQGIIDTLDPDLIPFTTWTFAEPHVQAALAQLTAYESDRGPTHISSANDQIDSVLSYFKPYHVIPTKLLRPLKASIKEFKSETDLFTSDLRVEATQIMQHLRDSKKEIVERSLVIREIANKAREFEEETFLGSGEEISTLEAIRGAKIEAARQILEIGNFHSKILSDPNSFKTRLDVFEGFMQEKQAAFEELHRTNAEKAERLTTFYTKIFGSKNQDGTTKQTGLDQELANRLTTMSIFETTQNTRYDALFTRIESLLPGASSAGLASAYEELAGEFIKPIRAYTNVFYGSLALLLLMAGITSIENIQFYPQTSINFISHGDWEVSLRALLNKLPYAGPLIWLAMFSSARRSQYERLQQEYAHKKALASSYESYKKELVDLDDGSQELLKALIGKAVDTVSFNASTTLDGKHSEPSPLTKLLDNLKRDDLEKIMDKLTDFLSKPKKE